MVVVNMETAIIKALLENGASFAGYTVITILFIYLFKKLFEKWDNYDKNSKDREEKAHEREQKLIDANEKLSIVMDKQTRTLDRINKSVDAQTEQMTKISFTVDVLKEDLKNTENKVTELWAKEKIRDNETA